MGEARHVAEEFVEAFNAHDEARMRSLDRDDVSFEGPGDVSLTGPDATTAYAMAWIHAFPDARIDVRNTIVGDGWPCRSSPSRGRTRTRSQGRAGRSPRRTGT